MPPPPQYNHAHTRSSCTLSPVTAALNPQMQTTYTKLKMTSTSPPHSITSATWIKKPELRAPNQKLPNIKVTCTSAGAANRLLTKCLFISNIRVATSKDILKPTQCNKCQLYGHIRSRCLSDECCATCTKDHATSSCPYPREPCCVSCSVALVHASFDWLKCPTFTEQSANLNTHLPENTMPLFPITD